MAVLDSLREKIISEVEKIGPHAREMADHIFDNPETWKNGIQYTRIPGR